MEIKVGEYVRTFNGLNRKNFNKRTNGKKLL